MAVDKLRAQAAVRELLIAIGEDPDREGLLGTPDRVARAYEELLSGMEEDPAHHLLKQFHEQDNQEMVLVRDIPFSSMCEHHMLPLWDALMLPISPEKAVLQGFLRLLAV